METWRCKSLWPLVVVTSLLCEGCYFFRNRGTGSDGEDGSGVGGYIGEKAGSVNQALLSGVHAIDTAHAPTSVRPDPDVFVRRLLLQYRDPGATVAREIGRVEQYRLLLGGASDDFSTAPAETYDATSLLAELKVAEEVCEGLVAPDASNHPGWVSILPAAAADYDTNLEFLAQRILGVPSSTISSDIIASLTAILDTATVGGRYTNDSYIPVCATLVIDAQALYL